MVCAFDASVDFLSERVWDWLVGVVVVEEVLFVVGEIREECAEFVEVVDVEVAVGLVDVCEPGRFAALAVPVSIPDLFGGVVPVRAIVCDVVAGVVLCESGGFFRVVP